MTILKAIVAVVICITAVGLIFIYSGIYNVAASNPHWPITYWILQTAKSRSISAHAYDLAIPADLDNEERQRRGAQSYASMCEICHLGPGVDPTPLHQGMYPRPPNLGEMASHHPPTYLFWAIKHGIKMTGMPAWSETHSDEELWDIVTFIDTLPRITPEQYERLSSNGHSH